MMRGEIGEVGRLCQWRYVKDDFSCHRGTKTAGSAGIAFEFISRFMRRHTRAGLGLRYLARVCWLG